MEYTDVDRNFLDKLIRNGELIVKSRSTGLELGWNEEIPNNDPLLTLPEFPNRSFEFAYKKAPFILPVDRKESYSAIRSIYIMHGHQGFHDFFHGNDLEPHFPSGYGSTPIMPEEHLSERAPIYRLLSRSREIVEQYVSQAVKKIEPYAQGVALTRLDHARVEIETEARRYFPILRNESNLSVLLLKYGEKAPIHGVDEKGKDFRELIDELGRIQEKIQVVSITRRTLGRRNLEKYEKMYSSLTGFKEGANIGPTLSHVEEAEITRLLNEDPELAPYRQSFEDAKQALYKYLSVTALDFPILWRIFQTENQMNPRLLGQEMRKALREAYEANLDLASEVKRNMRLVWHYRSVIDETLFLLNVPEVSIAKMAVEEKLRSEGNMRLSSVLSVISGFARMSAPELIAAGLAVETGIGVFIILADIVLNMIDAVQEYSDFRRQAAAYKACLNPNKSLAEEPSLLSAMLTIFFDILAVKS